MKVKLSGICKKERRRRGIYGPRCQERADGEHKQQITINLFYLPGDCRAFCCTCSKKVSKYLTITQIKKPAEHRQHSSNVHYYDYNAGSIGISIMYQHLQQEKCKFTNGVFPELKCKKILLPSQGYCSEQKRKQ